MHGSSAAVLSAGRLQGDGSEGHQPLPEAGSGAGLSNTALCYQHHHHMLGLDWIPEKAFFQTYQE